VIVLLPPSEGKAEGGRGAVKLGDRPLQVAKAMAEALDAGPAEWKRLLDATGPLGERAAEGWDAIAASQAPGLPAWKRFTGVVWLHLDPATLPAGARRRILVPNALTGVSRGDEQVPDFRAKLSISLPGLGRLDRWWRDSVTDVIASTGRGPIVDLLPKEHAATIDWARLGARRKVVPVRFVATDGAAAAGHAAKAVKGIVARTILLDGLEAADGMTWEGWSAQRSPDGALHVRAPG
jgi:cytoplasmic iron level regulating protein YaaA (DUF328/UPF0246 family)